MVLEEIDLTGSDDEEEEEAGSAAPPPPQPPQPVTPIKCKSEDPSDDAPVGDGEDDGLTPATTGEFVTQCRYCNPNISYAQNLI